WPPLLLQHRRETVADPLDLARVTLVPPRIRGVPEHGLTLPGARIAQQKGQLGGRFQSARLEARNRALAHLPPMRRIARIVGHRRGDPVVNDARLERFERESTAGL